VRVFVNGEPKEFPTSISLQKLVETLELGPERVAAELNGLVVPRSEWPIRLLGEDDRVEIVHFVGGGSGERT
jgi:thiamine biosynthesis protein ThiS